MIELIRHAHMPFGVFGYLKVDGETFTTVEKPWAGNEPFMSCIPEGHYALKKSYFHGGGYDTYQVMDVPNRSQIKIHVANLPDEIQGCIGIGSGFGSIRGQWGVTGSKDALAAFMDVMNGRMSDTIIIRSWAP